MGTEMTAFVEYDPTPDRWPTIGSTATMPPPFSSGEGEPYSVSEKGGLSTSRDSKFFAAIAGVGDVCKLEPLFHPRGLPPNVSPQVRESLDSHGELGHNTSWLKLNEVKAALDHHSVNRELLSFETETILRIMEDLVGRIGNERVRLVFGFSG
jgi:hypothetical protein